ncbi:ChaB [Actinomadura rubteroloni]|uniref:ChaB n=1 Tax=Actinomadura rubteroloni TaxID=1926885 RepID=A0A2P4UIP6_9ACTN|nr:ChaB family protein [Actinomadura rubteroloni]POM24906.1 ChaB [Actinomadura rubteroloni]
MPMTTRDGKVKKSELPSTIQRSDDKAQRTFAEAHDSAVSEYGAGQRANRVAYGALKHTHEKVGDHWQPKAGGAKGPSDPQSAGGRTTRRYDAQGVDMNASKEHLYDIAKKLDVPGRSSMSKLELVKAIEKANRRQTAKARSK